MNITINGKHCTANSDKNLLQIALDNDIYIPHFCYHEDEAVEANCRTCLVEIINPGANQDLKVGDIVTSCTLQPTEGLEINTESAAVKTLRDENLALLLSHHRFHCNTCPRGTMCSVMESVAKEKYNVRKYQELTTDVPLHQMGPSIEIDGNVCVACNQCVKACENMGIGYLKLEGKGTHNHVVPTDDPTIDCIYCGQCTVHCPVAAVREQYSLDDVETVLKDPSKKVIVQMAPAVRVSIGEGFGFPLGTNVEKQLYTAFRKIGFDYIFDTNWAADVTTIVEAEELIERITNHGTLPMFTSCCPAWIKFIEFYYPEMIPNITTARSPQIHGGGAYKTWWAEKAGINPQDIVVVSIMPCTSKKYEARREEMKIDGMWPVDYVLTARETIALLKKHQINLQAMEPSEADQLGEYSGAAVIFGASGGVMESALRTGAHMILGKDLDNIDLKAVRGLDGVKKATIPVGDLNLKVAIVSNPTNAKKIIEEIKQDPKAYDYIEFMACPGGCIAGGGQPLPTTKRVAQVRADGLYKTDAEKQCRLSYKNEVANDFLAYCKDAGHERAHQLLHTSYRKKNRGE